MSNQSQRNVSAAEQLKIPGRHLGDTPAKKSHHSDDPCAKTKLGNGTRVLNKVDNRLLWPRRLKELFEDHISMFPDASVAERSILWPASTLTVELERMETGFAMRGEASPQQLETYQRCANTLRRLLEAVGLRPRSKDVTSLGDLLRIDLQAEPDQ